jgi:SpoIIAA-like
MVLCRAYEPPDLLVVTLTGLLTARDQATLVEWVRDMLQSVRPVRVLVLLDRFEGWKPEAAFDSDALWLEDDDRIARMAIVGNAVWRLRLLAFIVQPVRHTPIEYFETEADARRWLSAGTISGPALPT